MIRAALLAAALVASGIACRPENAGDAGRASDSPLSGTTAADGSVHSEPASIPGDASIDELRALPYLNFSTEPADPSRSGVVVLDRALSQPGYNLYTNRSLCSAELITPTGGLLNSWTDGSLEDSGGVPISKTKGCRQWSHAELLDDGDLVLIGMDGMPPDETPGEPHPKLRARFLERRDWQGRSLWKRHLPVHHDVEALPDGTFLALAAAYRHGPNEGPNEGPDDGPPLYDNLLLRISAQGEALGEASLFDLFRAGPFDFDFQEIPPKKNQDGELAVDLFHCNSVETQSDPALARRGELYHLGNVLISSRHQDSIAIVDAGHRRLLWAWGRGELDGPHDAHWLANGHLMVFDNGLARGWSRIVEVDPLSGEIVWQYRADPPEDFYTASRGGNQRLTNGNTLVAESDRGRAFEVTPAGEVVWEFFSPHFSDDGRRATLVRMLRYSPAKIDAIREKHR